MRRLRLRLNPAPLSLAIALVLTVPGLVRAQTADRPTTQLPAVVVTGTTPDTSTELTNSYTSSNVQIGRGNLSLREIPQNVTVVTRQLMNDQNLQTLASAMQRTPGVISVPYGNGVIDFLIHGYPIDQYQFDGLAAGGAIGSYSTSSFDTALFDRIEVLKGPAGLLQGAGEPSGTINLARKRARKDFSISGAISTGSWDAYRGETDITGPLAQDGRLRGRLVAAQDNRNSYIDKTYAHKSVFYGTLEYDFDPATTLSVGATHQGGRSRPNFGLPNEVYYAEGRLNGRLLDIPRSMFLGDDWNRQSEDTTRYFADLEHRLSNGGEIRIAASALDRSVRQKTSAFGTGWPTPTGDMTFGAFNWRRIQRDRSVDAYVTTPFEFGRSHNLLVGVSGNSQEAHSTDSYYIGRNHVNNIFDPVHDTPEPNWSAMTPSGSLVKSSEKAMYSRLNVKLLDNATLIGGARVSWWEIKTPGGDSTENFKVNAKATPYAGFIYDLNKTYSVYASYAQVFKPQTGLTVDKNIIAPRKGNQYEVGTKAEWLDGKLNGQLALFRINDENRAVEDPVDPTFSVAARKARSQGVDIELTGQILPTWDISAGYTYVQTKYVADPENAGRAFSPNTPRHSFKLWNRHTFAQDALRNWTLGYGVLASSGVYAEEGSIRWSQGGYAIFSALIGYKINRNIDLALNANNIFDRKYYARVDGWTRQSYYGEPANAMLTVRARY